MCRSEINPEGCVREDTCERQIFPQLSVCEVALWGNLPRGELVIGGSSRQNLACTCIGIDLHQHELACLLILHLRDKGDVVGIHVVISVDGRLIGK